MSNTDAAKPLPVLPAPDHLPDDPVILKRMIQELLATLHEERHEREEMRARLHLLLQRLYGPRSERFDPGQPLLFPDIAQPAEPTPATTAPVEEPEAAAKKRSGHGRKRPPKDLPREERHHRVAEAELACPTCGTARQEIGTEATTQLDYKPASLFVVEHIEHKYACPCCSKQGQPHIVAGAKPAQPLGKGSPGAGLLAYLIVSKYADHLPLHRLERILGRQGLELARSTTCDWMAECARRLSQEQQALPKSKFGEAVTYALNQWEALCRYTTAGFLAIDNNAAEREMKRIAIGRKNWLFFGSSEGGKTAAILCTFTSTCSRLGVEPWAYLKDVLTRLPTMPKENLSDLLPNRWQAAQPQPPPAG
jgi:transposase